MKIREAPVEVVGYSDQRLPTIDVESGEVHMRWWSVKKDLRWIEFNHLINQILSPK